MDDLKVILDMYMSDQDEERATEKKDRKVRKDKKRRIDIRLSEKEYQLLLSKAGNDLETKTKKGDKANTSAYIRKCIFCRKIVLSDWKKS
ncbi:hypothetical protein NIA73_01220 [Anaerobutyricum hallii]|nr:hypothetical protein [Anaerobutyricum hallii]